MATLQNIRNRAGVLISIVIGLALAAFILGDFLKSGNSGPSDYEIAEISGTSIPYQFYELKLNELIENTKRNSNSQNIDDATMNSIREQTWEAILRENIMTKELSSLGITVTDDELEDIVFGKNIHPQVKQIPIFKDEQTSVFDKNLVLRFLQNLDQDKSGVARSSWKAFEVALTQTQMSDKYNNLIKKGLYITNYQAEMEAKEKKTASDIKFVYQNLNSIADSTITINDNDLKNYYDKNSEKFEQEAERILEYVVFNVVASKEDYKIAEQWINEINPEFAASINDQQFVNLNSDVAFVDKYNKEGELPARLDTVLFNAEKGTTYGPYFEGNAYKISKLTEVRMLPDSVKASHILIQPDQETGSYEAARSMVDSLKTLVENGASFEELAKQYGTDGSAEKGGDLGWFKREAMVYPFNDTCFFGKVGDIKTVATQFGVHLVKIVDKGKASRKVVVSTLVREVSPSQKTFDSFYRIASEFAGKNRTHESFNTAVNEQSLVKRVTPALKENDKNISGLENPRKIIRWAYKDAEKGEVSHVFDLSGKYVVAVLTDVKEKGIASFEDVKDLVSEAVIKEKKSQILIDKFNANVKDDITAYAQAMGLKVDAANRINFASTSIPQVGFEPALITASVSIPEGKISKPIKGNNGVFVVIANNKTEAVIEDTKQEQNSLSSYLQSRVDYEVYEALKKAANIKDFRVLYF